MDPRGERESGLRADRRVSRAWRAWPGSSTRAMVRHVCERALAQPPGVARGALGSQATTVGSRGGRVNEPPGFPTCRVYHRPSSSRLIAVAHRGDSRQHGEFPRRGSRRRAGALRRVRGRTGARPYDRATVLANYEFVGSFAVTSPAGWISSVTARPGHRSNLRLYWIAVDPLRRATGCGSALLDEVERRLEALHARMLVIETSSRSDYAADAGLLSPPRLRRGGSRSRLLRAATTIGSSSPNGCRAQPVDEGGERLQ